MAIAERMNRLKNSRLARGCTKLEFLLRPMIPLDTASLFFTASMALALAPGAGNVFVLLTPSALYGRSAGFFVTLGLCTIFMVSTAAVSVGGAAVFAM